MPEPLTVRGAIPHLDLADRLLIARRHAGLDQRELSALIGVSARSIGAAENGNSRPRRPVLMAWAMATGVSLEWICEGDLMPEASGLAGPGVILPRSRPVISRGSFGGMAGRPAVRRPPGRPGPGLRLGPGRGRGDYRTFTGL
jgi:transcriptional regulator with XRE-family HTH domain